MIFVFLLFFWRYFIVDCKFRILFLSVFIFFVVVIVFFWLVLVFFLLLVVEIMWLLDVICFYLLCFDFKVLSLWFCFLMLFVRVVVLDLVILRWELSLVMCLVLVFVLCMWDLSVLILIWVVDKFFFWMVMVWCVLLMLFLRCWSFFLVFIGIFLRVLIFCVCRSYGGWLCLNFWVWVRLVERVVRFEIWEVVWWSLLR